MPEVQPAKSMHNGDLDACLAWNEKASQARPLFAVPYGNIGFVHLQRGEILKAEKALRRAVSLDPNFVQALATLASALFMVTRKASAVSTTSAAGVQA